MCESGFQLEAEKIKTCKDSCRNGGGQYINPQDGVYIKAEICAKNPDLALFVGIHKYKLTFDDLRETFLEINESLKKLQWHKNWKYNESLCSKFPL